MRSSSSGQPILRATLNLLPKSPAKLPAKDKQKDRMAALIRITTGNLSQASPMIPPIMADVKPLQIGALGSLRTSGNEKPQHCGAGARNTARVDPASDIERNS